MTRSLFVLALAACVACGRATEPATPVASPPDPAQVLGQMFATLGGSRQLTFNATRHLDASLALGGTVQESTQVEVWVSRPGMVRARSVSDAGVRLLYANGQQVSLVDEEMKFYASTPLGGSIDDVVESLEDRYGFAPPLAEFIVNDPAKRFGALIQSSQYRGRETLEGTECDRVTLIGEVADADVWVAVATHLPRKFVATFKDREGSPQLTIDFSDWKLDATLDPSMFAFIPPADAQRIEMATTDDANAADATGGQP